MPTLQENSEGAAVKKLQEALKKRGFNPGAVDGDFGPATNAAVLAFQKSERLLADGVAGPRTQQALGLVNDDTLPRGIPGVTVRVVSQMFPVTPLDNIKTNLPFVCNGLVEKSLVDKPMVLMALATIRAETESFEPISEGKSIFNTSPGGKPFDLYDNRKDLGNQGGGDGDEILRTRIHSAHWKAQLPDIWQGTRNKLAQQPGSSQRFDNCRATFGDLFKNKGTGD